jgi:hypothetical protein
MNTTKRYVHPSDDDIQEAMDRIGGHVAAAVVSQGVPVFEPEF